MKWLLLLTILSGYSGSSTVAANFDSKDVCEAAAKSHEEAIRRLHWHSFEIVWTCSQITSGKDLQIEVTRIPPVTWGFGKSGLEGAQLGRRCSSKKHEHLRG